jgi:hypothetical protein
VGFPRIAAPQYRETPLQLFKENADQNSSILKSTGSQGEEQLWDFRELLDHNIAETPLQLFK